MERERHKDLAQTVLNEYGSDVGSERYPGKRTLTDGLVAPEHELVWRARDDAGAPLPAPAAKELAAASGQNLDDVRLHQGPGSQAAASAISARAFTVGKDIHLGAGSDDLSTPDGRFLLAHEVAHTIQGVGTSDAPAPKALELTGIGSAAELEADQFAASFAFGQGRRTPLTVGSLGSTVVARQAIAPAPAPATPPTPQQMVPGAAPAAESQTPGDFAGWSRRSDELGRALDRVSYKRMLEEPRLSLARGGATPFFVTTLPPAASIYREPRTNEQHEVR